MPPKKQVEPYDYRIAPDGEEVGQKLLYLWKPAFLASFSLGTSDVMLYTKPTTYSHVLGRYLYMSIPVMGATTVFVLGSNMAGSIRKKNDKYNWAVGGALSGGVLGAWCRSSPVGWVSGMVLAFSAATIRFYQLQGYDIVPSLNVPRIYGDALVRKKDYSILSAPKEDS